MPGTLTDKKSTFARRINSTASYVTKLIKMGMPVTDAGDIPVTDALHWIRDNLKSTAGRPEGRLNGISDDGTPASEELLQVRIRLVTAQAARAEHELEISQGKHVDLQEARKAIRMFSRVQRDAWLNFGNRYAAQIAAELGVHQGACAGILDRYIREELIAISATPPPLGADQCICEKCKTEDVSDHK